MAYESGLPEAPPENPSSKAVPGLVAARQLPALPSAPRGLPARPAGFYAPGAIRQASDVEHALVLTFLNAHPEYQGVGYDVLLQTAETFRTDDEHAARDVLAAEGVPEDWAPADDNNRESE